MKVTDSVKVNSPASQELGEGDVEET